jgi:hypothetical protein
MDVVNSPIYATGVGLVLYGAENCRLSPGGLRSAGLLKRIGKWFGEFI